MISDALDLSTVQIHNAPGDIASWSQTVDLTQRSEEKDDDVFARIGHDGGRRR